MRPGRVSRASQTVFDGLAEIILERAPGSFSGNTAYASRERGSAAVLCGTVHGPRLLL